MSFSHALDFIRQIQTDRQLRDRIATVPEGKLFESLVTWGAECELSFTAQEFEAAFKHDWRLRWLKFGTRHRYEASPADLEAQ